MREKVANKKDLKWVVWKREFKKKAIGDSRELTYELFKKGYSINQISKDRGFKLETTEGHIIDLITHGFIDVFDVVSKDVVLKVESKVNEKSVDSLKVIFESLKMKISYFEIKCVLASIASKPE